MAESKLTPKQVDFIRHYFECGKNASEAMRRAGYKSKNIDVDSAKLLVNPGIQAAIAAKEADAQTRHGITLDMLIKEVTGIAFSDPGDLMDWDEGSMKLVPKRDLKPGLSKGVHSITYTTGEKGSSIRMTTQAGEKMKALEFLAKLLGFDRKEAMESESEKILKAAILELDKD